MDQLAKRRNQRPGGRVGIARVLVAVLSAGLLFGGMTVSAAGATSPGPRLRTVVAGLDNPRGVIFLPNGTLAVADAGHAGRLCLGRGECGGLTGQIIAVNPRSGHQTTLATGFPSIGESFAPFGLGGLAVRRGKLYAIVGENPQEFGNPNRDCTGRRHRGACVATLRRIIGEVGNFVEVRSLSANHGWRTLARVGRFDVDYAAGHPQPGTPPDGDPFGLITRPSGGFYVVDAASNTLGTVDAQGKSSVLGFVPDPPHHTPIFDAAPTCAARTADGALVVGTESGMLLRWQNGNFSSLLVGGKVQQVVACVADAQGNVYLANLDHSVKNFIGRPFTGSIVKVTPDLKTSYIVRGINYPTGMTLGPDGHLYVTANGLCPADLTLVNHHNSPPHACPHSGEVLRIDQR